jgi:hypothetical protein
MQIAPLPSYYFQPGHQDMRTSKQKVAPAVSALLLFNVKLKRESAKTTLGTLNFEKNFK